MTLKVNCPRCDGKGWVIGTSEVTKFSKYRCALCLGSGSVSDDEAERYLEKQMDKE